jgi:uncharacterized protein YkwD
MKVWQAKALYAATIIGVSLFAACGGGGGSSCDTTARTLEAVNTARAAGAWCGPAVGPVVIDPTLQHVAQSFADDLARNGIRAGHVGSDGSTFGDRLVKAGYRWSWAGENTAFGTDGASATVAAFRDSSGHCTNLMAPQATQAGLACTSDGESAYWVQVMGARP